jgi:hypothetical protein
MHTKSLGHYLIEHFTVNSKTEHSLSYHTPSLFPLCHLSEIVNGTSIHPVTPFSSEWPLNHYQSDLLKMQFLLFCTSNYKINFVVFSSDKDYQ